MNWEVIGAVGQLVGAVVLIATLFYLAVQIGQNSKSIRTAAAYSVHQGLAEINRRISNDPEFADLLIRGWQDYYGLPFVERIRFEAFAYDLINLAVYCHKLSKEEEMANIHIDFIAYVGSLIQNSPGFRDFLDTLEKRAPTGVVPEDLLKRLRGGA